MQSDGLLVDEIVGNSKDLESLLRDHNAANLMEVGTLNRVSRIQALKPGGVYRTVSFDELRVIQKTAGEMPIGSPLGSTVKCPSDLLFSLPFVQARRSSSTSPTRTAVGLSPRPCSFTTLQTSQCCLGRTAE